MQQRSLIPDLPLFDAPAEKALRVFKRLRVPDIVGTPTYGVACGDWVFDLVRVLFGSYDPELKRRMIREFFVLIPKKNGKSSIAAAIMVTAAIVNERPEAELLLIAPTKEIAGIAFKQAAGIIKLDDALSALFHQQSHLRMITHRITGATIMIKASDADVITGSKATFILIDETHVFALKANAADVFVEIRGSLAARPDGFLLQITTQSKAPPAGVFKAELSTARAVRDGEIVLPLLPLLFELPEDVAKDGGWKDPATWPLVNPNLNKSVDEAFLRDELLKAERDGAEKLALIASQHFNVEVGLSLRNDRWRGADYWLAQGDPELTLDTLLARSEVVTVGVDGGGLDDLFGLAVIGRCKVTRDWLVWAKGWGHSDVLALRQDIAPALQDFAEEGEFTICDDPLTPYLEAADIIKAVFDLDLLPEEHGIGLDPFGVVDLVNELALRGIEGAILSAIGQGAKLSPSTWGIEIKLKNKTLWHVVSTFMNWVIGNAKTEVRGGAVVITKQTAGRAKIDPLVAILNAGILMSRNPAAREAGWKNYLASLGGKA